MEERRMNKRGKKKIKDLVDMLEDPENSGYIGGDYEDMMELLEQEQHSCTIVVLLTQDQHVIFFVPRGIIL